MATSRLQMMAEECDASGFCDWDELTERYASLLERQRIAVEEFNRQIESLFLQEVSDNFQLELQEELVAAAGVTQDMDSLVRIPMIVLCRTLEDNERRHLQRHGKEKTSSWNALLVQLHGVLDPLFRDGLKTASKLALRHGRDARALFLEALNSRIQVLRSRCEETLEQKTKATMDFDSLKSRSKREFQEACRCAVYLSTAQISDDFVETQARQQVARSMIEFARWPLKQQEKQGLLDQLSQSEAYYEDFEERETFFDLNFFAEFWSDESDSEIEEEPQIEACEIPEELLRQLYACKDTTMDLTGSHLQL